MTLFRGGCHKLYVTGLPSKLGRISNSTGILNLWELFSKKKRGGDVRETQCNNPIEPWEEEEQ